MTGKIEGTKERIALYRELMKFFGYLFYIGIIISGWLIDKFNLYSASAVNETSLWPRIVTIMYPLMAAFSLITSFWFRKKAEKLIRQLESIESSHIPKD